MRKACGRGSVVGVCLAAELAEAVFDGKGRGGAQVHVDFDGFHLGGVVLEQAQLGVDSLAGVEGYHVGVEVGDEQGLAGAWVGQGYEVDDFVDVAFGILDESLPLYFAGASGDGVCLETGLEVCEAVCPDVAFKGIFFVWGAFLASACFSA